MNSLTSKQKEEVDGGGPGRSEVVQELSWCFLRLRSLRLLIRAECNGGRTRDGQRQLLSVSGSRRERWGKNRKRHCDLLIPLEVPASVQRSGDDEAFVIIFWRANVGLRYCL